MQKLIKELDSDHELILKKMDEMSAFLEEKDFSKTFPRLLEVLKFFEKFTFSEHHTREENILYKWMKDQNKNSDKDLINKIVDDHKFLEKLLIEIRTHVESILNKKEAVSENVIAAELTFFLTMYREHVERESSFIFVVANALCPTEKN